MSKIIIYINGNPKVHGFKRREFTWSEPHGCYLYRSREYELYEFNELYEKAMKTNADMLPRVKVLLSVDAGAQTPLTDEQMLDQAEAIINRIDPTRLKKKTGPTPQKTQPLEVELIDANNRTGS